MTGLPAPSGRCTADCQEAIACLVCQRELDPHAACFREIHAVVRLWECLELTGVDLSDGPYEGWEDDAVKEVKRLRHDHDAYGAEVDRTAALLDQIGHDLRTFEP